jgi:archaellum component FlaC
LNPTDPAVPVSPAARATTVTFAETLRGGMGLGSATKRIQQVADTAEKLYERLNELRAQVNAMREDIAETRNQVDAMEHEVDRQAVVLEALAEKEGIDVDRLHAEAAIEEAETDGGEGGSQ